MPFNSDASARERPGPPVDRPSPLIHWPTKPKNNASSSETTAARTRSLAQLCCAETDDRSLMKPRRDECSGRREFERAGRVAGRSSGHRTRPSPSHGHPALSRVHPDAIREGVLSGPRKIQSWPLERTGGAENQVRKE